MSKISQIALSPYYAYVGVKSVFNKLKGTRLSLKETDYQKWLSLEESNRKAHSISKQKVVAVISAEDSILISNLKNAGISYIVESEKVLTKKTTEALSD